MSTFDQPSTLKTYLPVIIGGVVAVALLIGGFIGVQKLLTPTDSFKSLDVMVRPHNPTSGKKDASVNLLYLYDYQCSACQSNADNMIALKKDYGDKISFTYKHYIVHAGSGNRMAQAAQAARIQLGNDKFYDFSDKLIKLTPDAQAGLSVDKLTDLAKQFNMDTTKFIKDYNSVEVEEDIKLDQKDISKAILPASKYDGKVTPSATPTIILIKDGKYTDNWWSSVLDVATVKSRIDTLLK
jgi:protein-disulfide isomerase